MINKKEFNIIGMIVTQSFAGTKRFDFTHISQLNHIINPLSNSDNYYVDAGKGNYSELYVLDPQDEGNGIIIGGIQYFGKALNTLYIKFQNFENEQIIDSL
jgi:hypothetical protein